MVWLHWVFVAAHRLSLVVACGILVPRAGINPSPLHWKADSFYLFIYLWPSWVFVAVCGLSLVVVSMGPLLPTCSMQSSYCSGFSCCRAQALGCLGFSCYGMWAQQLWLSGLLALQHVESSQTRDGTHVHCTGRFLTTGLPGKSHSE